MQRERMTLLHGDSYELIKTIPDKSVDLIITDPPYEIDGIHYSGIMKERKLNPNHYMNQIHFNDIDVGINLNILEEFVRVLKYIYIYIWCNKEQIYDYMNFFTKKYKCNYEFFIWHKSNIPPFCSTHYLKDKEYCLLFWEKGAKLNGSYETMATVYNSGTNLKDKQLYNHPCIKPLPIIKNFILNSTQEGDVVLDCFMGSGTTGVACKELNREFIGIEINKEYYDIAVDRINGITVQERKQKNNGQLNIYDFTPKI